MNRQLRNGKEITSRRRMLLRGLSGSSRPDRALSLDLRLRAISERIPAASIDELWVFPPLPDREIACEFIVLVCYDGGEDRRRIVTSHVDARFGDEESDEIEWVQRLRDHGSAPQRWLTEIPDRLLQRMAEAGIPQVVEVGGKTEAFEEAIASFAEAGGRLNVNGNGSENGSEAERALHVDSGLRQEISFSTITESLVMSNGSQFDSYT